jgi:hypothetical protein
MSQVLEQLELAEGSFGENWSAEWLHDFFDGHGLAGDLILGGTGEVRPWNKRKADWAHQTRPKAPMPTGWSSVYLFGKVRHSARQ